MQQTPAHEIHNPDLLAIMPVSCGSVIEVGCSSGAMAREFKKINPSCNYFGLEIDAGYTELARRYCDAAETLDIEAAGTEFYQAHGERDCWVFGDALEHLKDPWKVLRNIRSVIPDDGCVVACIPNAQHWSIQAKLAIGDFRYEESGLLDKTHLRWFTRQTIMELFAHTGFELAAGWPRIFDDPNRDRFLPMIGEMATAAGCDPHTAMDDAMPLQYVVRAVPC